MLTVTAATPPARERRRRGPPRGWRADPGLRGLLVATTAAFVLWVSSTPAGHPMSTVVVVAVLFLPTLLYAAISKEYPPIETRWRQRVAWASLLAVASLLVSPWPLQLRFALARPELERAVADVRAGREVEGRRSALSSLREARLARSWEGEAGDPARAPVHLAIGVGALLHLPDGDPGRPIVLGPWESAVVGIRLAEDWYTVAD